MSDTVFWFVLIYLCALPFIGILGRLNSREDSLKDYYLAGGMLATLPLFLTLYATQYSGNTLFGFAGNAYRAGPVTLFTALGMMSVIFFYLMFGKELNTKARTLGFITPADYLTHRFGRGALVTLVNLILIFALASYVLTNFKAVGLLAEQVSNGRVTAAYGIFGLALIMAFYESMGGMRSVVWTDMLQGTLLLIGCLGLAICVMAQFGGLTPMLQEISANPSPAWAPMNGEQWRQGISLVILFGTAIAVYPHAIQRLYAARHWTNLRNSFWLMGAMPFITTVPVVLSALAATLLLPGLTGREADQVMPRLVAFLMTETPALELFFALFMAAAMAAIMSTLDSAMLSLGSIFMHDILRRALPQLDEAKLTRAGRGMSWALMLVVAGLALSLPQDIWSLIVIKLDLLSQAFPAFALGAMLPALSGRAVLVGLIGGCATAIGLRYGVIPIQTGGLHFGVVGLMVNLTLIALTHWSMGRSAVKKPA
jgi:Na+/proline symporter